MASISNNGIITLQRGDCFRAPIYINLGSKSFPEYYELNDYDTIYISICEPSKEFEDGIIKRVITKEQFDLEKHAWLILNSEDTVNLLPGTYYYEIKIKLYDNLSVFTVVPRRKFIIL